MLSWFAEKYSKALWNIFIRNSQTFLAMLLIFLNLCVMISFATMYFLTLLCGHTYAFVWPFQKLTKNLCYYFYYKFYPLLHYAIAIHYWNDRSCMLYTLTYHVLLTVWNSVFHSLCMKSGASVFLGFCFGNFW